MMLSPVLLGLTLLIIVPALMTIPLAFTRYDALSSPEWLGLGNFREMLHDGMFFNGLRASLVYVLLAVPIRLLGALLLALLLHRPGRGRTFIRGAIYLPTVVPDIAYALLWLYIFNPLFSPLNVFLPLFGGRGSTPAGWLLNGTSAQVAIAIVLFWTLGEGFVLLMATLQDIPRAMLESAAIDGASRWQVLTRITLPMLAPMLLLIIFRDTIRSFQANFVATVILTNGGPYYATSYLPFWIWQNAIDYQRFGYAAAMTLVLSAVTVVAIALQFVVVRRWRTGYFE